MEIMFKERGTHQPIVNPKKEIVVEQQIICSICAENCIASWKHPSSFLFLIDHLKQLIFDWCCKWNDDLHLPQLQMRQHHSFQLPCCGTQQVCLQCCYRQIQTCFEGGMTGQSHNGRIQCPNCRKEWKDSYIRTILSCYHFANSMSTAMWNVIGQILLSLLTLCGYFSEKLQNPFRSSRYYTSWNYWLHSADILQDLERYEQWSLTVALRRSNDDNNRTMVVVCPKADCNFRWIVADSHQYRRKQVNEETSWVSSWRYKPPKPECIPLDWFEPISLESYDLTLHQIQSDRRRRQDGRKVTCAKCHTSFCGLCRQPWQLLPNNNNNGTTHSKITCSTYAKNLPRQDDTNDFQFVVARVIRKCPKCKVFTQRIDGCNHMTCPCGMEWCYVCERKWNKRHYSCVDRKMKNGSNNGTCQIM